MAVNKNKTDRIHDQLPRVYKTKQNPNWKALIGALGESDQRLADLTEEVRQQFFVKTASRPYIDRLGANFKVSRPRFVGMQDTDFRRYIPVLAYQPKQVKLVMDALLDIFFFKETTTSFTQSQAFAPFVLKDGWELEYKVDQIHEERIVFTTADFTNIALATAEEVVSAINRQARNSFAIVFDDRIQKKKFIRLFSNTVGSKGSIQVTGGRADIGLQFKGFIGGAGATLGTAWTITKIGDTMTFQHTAGPTPNLNQVQAGDIVIIDIPGNSGSFVIKSIDLSTSSFTFVNLFGTAGFEAGIVSATRAANIVTVLTSIPHTLSIGNTVTIANTTLDMTMNGIFTVVSTPTPNSFTYASTGASGVNTGGVSRPISHTHTALTALNFISPLKLVIYTNDSRSVVWEVSPGQIIVEMPASPPVVKRNLEGSAHFNSLSERVVNRLSTSSLEIQDAADWPLNGGQFVIQELKEIKTHVLTTSEDIILSKDFNTRFNKQQRYSYTSKTGNILNGITPNLPEVSALFEANISTATRAGTTVTVVTTTPHGFLVGEGVRVQNTVADTSINGTFIVTSTPTSTSFTYSSAGAAGVNTGGVCRTERIGMSNDGSIAYLTSAQLDTGILGPYTWDLNAAFVLSSLTSTIQSEIKAGNNVRTMQIAAPNNLANEESFAIFDFGTEFQEGPVRILYKPTANSIQLDPAYVFKQNHEVGSSVTVIRKRGAIVMSGIGKEYSAYITDPGVAREILQDLMRQVKSVGIFIEFLVRFPQQLYSTLDVYRSDSEILYPIGQQ